MHTSSGICRRHTSADRRAPDRERRLPISNGRKTGVLFGLFTLCFALAVGCASIGPRAAPTIAAPPDAPLRARLAWDGSYSADIQPIFSQYCVQCHGPDNPANALRLDSYEGVLKGTQFGPVVVPGSPSSSTLVAVIQGTAAPEIRMPHQGRQLSPARIQNITLWIEAGAKKD